MVSGNDVTMATEIQFAREGGAGTHTVTVPDLTSARIITEALQRAGYSVNLRGAAERMPEDVREIVEEVKRLVREGDRRLRFQLAAKGDQAWADQMLDAIQRLEAAYSQTGAVDEPR